MVSGPISGSCHCGNVRIVVAELPRDVNSCNCSVCRRLGTLWAYYHPDQVQITAEQATVAYIRGDRVLAFHHCGKCGCTIHWESITPDYTHRMGVNARMFDIDIAQIPVRFSDGASA